MRSNILPRDGTVPRYRVRHRDRQREHEHRDHTVVERRQANDPQRMHADSWSWPTRAPSPTNSRPATTPAPAAIAGRIQVAGRARVFCMLPDEERGEPEGQRGEPEGGLQEQVHASPAAKPNAAPSSGPYRTDIATAATSPSSGTTPAIRRCGNTAVCNTVMKIRNNPSRISRTIITAPAIAGSARTQ